LFSSLNGVERVAVDQNGTSISSFDYGALWSTSEFSFQVTNGGNFVIEDISISSDNAFFDVRPTSLTKLEPFERDSGLITTVSVSIEHGLGKLGAYNAPLLPMGPHVAILTLNGTSGGSSVSGSFSIAIDAKVLDVSAYENESSTTPITDWIGNGLNISGLIGLNLGGLSSLPRYRMSAIGFPEIENTGNVPFTAYFGTAQTDSPSNATVAPGQRVPIDAWVLSGDTRAVAIQGEGMMDRTRFAVGHDGLIYLGFYGDF